MTSSPNRVNLVVLKSATEKFPSESSNTTEPFLTSPRLVSKNVAPKKSKTSRIRSASVGAESKPPSLEVRSNSRGFAGESSDSNKSIDSTINYPMRPHLVNSHPTKIPAGAHNSGYFRKVMKSKSDLDNSHLSLTNMLDDIGLRNSRPPSTEKLSHAITTIFKSQERRASVTTTFNSVEIEIWKGVPDRPFVENVLAILTDPDLEVELAVSELKKLHQLTSQETSPPYSQVLQDSGAVSVLLKLISKLSHSAIAQAYINMLLNFIIEGAESSNVVKLFSWQTMKSVLKSNEITSKAYIAAMDGVRNSGLQRRMSKNIESLAAFSSRRPDVLGIMEEPENIKIVKNSSNSLRDSVYGKFFKPEYLDEVSKMDPEQFLRTISEFLKLFNNFEMLINENNSLSLDSSFVESLENIFPRAKSIISADNLYFFQVNEETKELKLINDDGVQNIFPANVGLIGYSVKLQNMINVRDPSGCQFYDPAIDTCNRPSHPQSMLILPIKSDELNVTSVLVAIDKKSNSIGTNSYFTDEDEFIFYRLGVTIGALMRNGKIYEAMMTTKKKVTVLLETTRSLASILDLNRLISVIMDSAKELLSSDRCTLFLHDPDRKQLRAIVQGRDNVQEIRIATNAGIAGAVFTSGVPINIHDAYQDARFNREVDKQTGYTTKTILCMPIKNIHGECIGVTQMINKNFGCFTDEDEMILGSFSSQAAVAIEKSQLFKKTEDMRNYLQSILSSITSSVITLSDNLRMNTINRPWLLEKLGVSEDRAKSSPATTWLEPNSEFIRAINQVYDNREPIYGNEVEIVGQNGNSIVNYQIMPLIGSSGVVIVIDDISSEKRAVMTLGRYMSPALAKQVMEDGASKLGGERKKVSILFSDIRSFTTLAEDMDPHEVVELLNQHFTNAVNAITEEQGILDKFIGDAVMAVFGVPFAHDDDAIKSCNTALKMREAMREWNIQRKIQGKKLLAVGIGINTGVRMEFSCIGDSVNLASRVEGLTKYYGVTILITEHTLADTKNQFITREVDLVVVTGKKASVRMYELIGKVGDQLDTVFLETLRFYKEGLELYRRKDFTKAIQRFQTAVDMTNDGPSKCMLKRAQEYILDPPEDSWNGEYTATAK